MLQEGVLAEKGKAIIKRRLKNADQFPTSLRSRPNGISFKGSDHQCLKHCIKSSGIMTQWWPQEVNKRKIVSNVQVRHEIPEDKNKRKSLFFTDRNGNEKAELVTVQEV